MFDILGIKKSKLRENLLRLWFSDTEKKFYLRQLEKIIGFSAGNIKKELKNLENGGFIYSTKQGNLVYYALNKNHPLFKEIKSIISKTIGVEAILRGFFKKIKNIKAAFIYGSFASEKESSASDIDLFIIGSPDEIKLSGIIRDMEDKLDREINYNLYSEKDFAKKRKEEDYFISDVIKNKKIFLAGGLDELR